MSLTDDELRYLAEHGREQISDACSQERLVKKLAAELLGKRFELSCARGFDVETGAATGGSGQPAHGPMPEVMQTEGNSRNRFWRWPWRNE